ncbi:uncharacterized protein [Centruroides vittatus]|uniref:uncharacterized protein n=1 Tax=Centruroides vittatus TaxID=120091 RepID=UPI003510642A
MDLIEKDILLNNSFHTGNNSCIVIIRNFFSRKIELLVNRIKLFFNKEMKENEEKHVNQSSYINNNVTSILASSNSHKTKFNLIIPELIALGGNDDSRSSVKICSEEIEKDLPCCNGRYLPAVMSGHDDISFIGQNKSNRSKQSGGVESRAIPDD